MRDWLVLMAHLIVTSIRIMALGGARAVITESLLLKHQLLILSRSRKRAPNLRSLDRVLLGLGAMLVSPQRMLKVAVAITPRRCCDFTAPASSTRRLLRNQEFAMVRQRVTFQTAPVSTSFPPDEPSQPVASGLGRQFNAFHFKHPITGETLRTPASDPNSD